MLNAMRSKVGGYIAKFLMVLLIISFAIWGVGDIGRNDFGSFVAEVGKERISIAEFQRQVRLFTRALQAAGISNPDPAILERQMLRRMIEEKLTKQMLHDTGLRVGDALLAKELRQAPTLQKPDGSFNAEAFHTMLRQRQITEAGFLDQLKTDLENQTLAESVSSEDLTLPESYLKLQARAAGQTRDAVIVTLPVAGAQVAAASEDELKDYYELQKDLIYRQEERRTLDYATITQADVNALVAKEKGTDDARDRVMQNITDRIEDTLAAGKSMGEALKEAGLHPSIRQLKDVTEASGTDDVSRAVIAEGMKLSQGETSNLQVAKGGTYFLVTVSKLTPAAPKPFAEVKQDVTKRFTAEAKRDAVTLRAQSIMVDLGKGGDWKAALAKANVSGQPMNGLTRNGSGSLPEALRAAIFEHAPGEAAGPLNLPNGDAMIAIVTGVHSGTAAKLDEKARKQLADDLNQEVFAQYFNGLAQRYPVTINDRLFAKARKAENE